MTNLPPEIGQTGGLLGSFAAVFFVFKMVNTYVAKEVEKGVSKIEVEFEAYKNKVSSAISESHTILSETSSPDVMKAIHRILAKLIH